MKFILRIFYDHLSSKKGTKGDLKSVGIFYTTMSCLLLSFKFYKLLSKSFFCNVDLHFLIMSRLHK